MKIALIAKVLAVALAVVFFVPTSMTYIKGADQKVEPNNANYVIIYVPGTNSQLLSPYGVLIIETYDGFVLAKADDNQLAALRSHNINAEAAPDLFTIGLKAVTFDVRSGEPALPDSLKFGQYSPGTLGYYIVQFIGPVKDEWKWDLEARGATILGYIPNNAFLVSMTPEVRDSMYGSKHVSWTGIYHPAYKIDPALYTMSGIVPVEIVSFHGRSINPVVAFLNVLGYTAARFSDVTPGIISFSQGESYGVLKARIDASLIPTIARMSGVEYVEPYYEPRPENFLSQAVMQTDQDPYLIPGARKIWENGIRGQGQIVASADTGLDYDHNMFRQSPSTIQNGDIYNVTDLTRRKVVRYLPMSNYSNVNPWTGDPWAIKDSSQNSGPCTSGHGTSTTATASGNDDGIASSDNDGMAKENKIFFQDIGTVGPSVRCGNGLDDLLSYIPDDLNLLFGPAYGGGARVHTNSWGGGTNAYALNSMQIDEFMWKHPDFLVVFAEGNDGGVLGHVQQQAAAKNVLSAGGSFNYPSENGMTTYSAYGPTADGRMKPTMTFVSEGTTAWSDGDPISNQMLDAEWNFGGTSYAAPDAAGQAALVRQYYTDGWYPMGQPRANASFVPQASLITATLAASAVKMTGARTNPAAENRYPNDAQGYGRVLLDNALYFRGDDRFLKVVDDRSGLKTSQWEQYDYYVTNSSQILKVVLAWTDYPGTVGASKALVNDLNLLVTAPNGDTFKGNVWDAFASGQSKRNTGAFDNLNNIEGVIVNTPDIGKWTVRVTANDVPAGPQPFSLVTVGGIDPDYGLVLLDRHTYAPDCLTGDIINMTVVDTGARGTVTVNVTSGMEPYDEETTLTETGPGTGVFKGSMRTSLGTPKPNGTIEVGDGDTVWVTYSDLSPVHDAIAHADIASAKPSVYNVRVSGITSSTATIAWQTNKPSDSSILYGTIAPPTNLKFERELRVSHSITLVNLQTAALYYFDVGSSDGRGHATVDKNGGSHYAFKTTPKGELLLVLGDETYEQQRPEGVRAYRTSLAAKGWSYNEWHVTYSGDPPLALLQTYKVVIWQVGLEEYPPHTDAELALIKSYVDSGGRLFYVHHDAFWAFCGLTSSWIDSAKCQWAKDILKGSFNSFNANQGDPQTLTGIVGETGDEISDTYSLGGVNYPTTYVPFRNGGASDEVTKHDAGGLSSYVWSDSGGDATPDKISIKWTSSGANGTVGVGVWGGAASKLVGLYANWIDIDYLPGMPFSVKRTDILDKTIIWLLGMRDHPDVTVSTPNGGETYNGNSLTIFWNRTTLGTNVFSQAAYYSGDAGQSWFPIAFNIPAVNVSHPWYLSNICNGDNFMVRIEVQDDGSPKFNASDDSDNVFTIDRPNGDCGGPLTWAGSVSVQPTPVMGAVTAYINATVDDTTRGNSNIDVTKPAEFFFDVVGANGTGWAMNLTSPPTSTVEDVQWTGRLDWMTKGCHYIYLHGRDVTGQWGPFESTLFCVQNTLPPRPPRPARNVDAVLINGANDIRITWTLSPDDVLNLDHYEVWRSVGVYDKNKGASYAWLGNASRGTAFFVHAGVGRDANSYFYFVKAVNAGGSADSVEQSAKFARSLAVGTQLVSVPIQAQDQTIPSVMQTLSYDSVRWFDPTNSVDPWKSYKPGRSYNDFTTSTMGKGFWVDVTANGVFCVAGKVLPSTSINLKAGWNLIGFPEFVAPYTVADFKAALPGHVIQIEAYSAAAGQYHLMKTWDQYVMSPGYGYWVQVTNDGTWTAYN